MSSLVLLLVAVDKSPAKDARTALQESRVSQLGTCILCLLRVLKVRGVWWESLGHETPEREKPWAKPSILYLRQEKGKGLIKTTQLICTRIN